MTKQKPGPKPYSPNIFRTNYTFRLNKAEREKLKRDAELFGFEQVSMYLRFRLGLDDGQNTHDNVSLKAGGD